MAIETSNGEKNVPGTPPENRISQDEIANVKAPPKKAANAPVTQGRVTLPDASVTTAVTQDPENVHVRTKRLYSGKVS